MIDILSLVPPTDLHFCYKIVTSNGNHEANIRGGKETVHFVFKETVSRDGFGFCDIHGQF